MFQLALRAMLNDRARLLTCLLGVAFSVALVNLQGGLFFGLIQKASLLIDYGKADIWVGHRFMNNTDIGGLVPERWVHRIRTVEGVARVEPYVINFGQMTMPDGRFENVIVVGSDPSSMLGNAWEMSQGDPGAIRRPDAILIDVCDAPKLGSPRIGEFREINSRRARIVGFTRNIVGFTTQPYVFTTIDRARQRYSVSIKRDQCSFFLVLAKPGTDVPALCRRIQERVPELDVRDRRKWSLTCMEYWLLRTGIGISFGLSTVLGLMVGLGVVAHTLYASVNDRAKEFATLKALGADDRCIAKFLLCQAFAGGVGGSSMGLLTSLAVGMLMDSPRAPVALTWQVAFASAILVTGVCCLSAWLPYWRIRRIDPAGVLRG